MFSNYSLGVDKRSRTDKLDRKMGADEEARKKAICLYRILSIIQLLLGVALLTCGGLGTRYESGSFGPPFFIGGFIVGTFMVISALLCMCVWYKGSETSAGNEVQRREVACGVMGQYILAMFTFMGCFIGLVFAGIGTCDNDSYFDDDVECPPERAAIRYAIIVLVVVAILTNIFSMYIVCTYGSYFGVVMTSRGRRGRFVMAINTTANTPVYNTHPVTGTYTSDIGRNEARTQELERQNALLQQQLELQRQYNQNPPPYSGGYPPPQPATYGGFSTDPAFPPTTSFPAPASSFPAPDAPPPTYSSLGIPK